MYSFTYWSRTALRQTNKQNKNKIKQVIKTCCQYEKTALGSSVLLNFKIVFFNHWLIWAQSSRGLHCVAVWGSYPSITSLQNTWQVAQSKFWHVQGECNWTLVHRNIWVCKFFKKQKKTLICSHYEQRVQTCGWIGCFSSVRELFVDKTVFTSSQKWMCTLLSAFLFC